MSGRRHKSKRFKPSPARQESALPRASLASSTPQQFAVKMWLALGLAISSAAVAFFWFGRDSRPTTEQVATEHGLASEPASDIAIDASAELTSLLTTAAVKADQAITNTQLDPAQDGWETEVVAEQAKKTLTRLCGRLVSPDVADMPIAEVSIEVTGNQLRPAKLAEVFGDGKEGERTVVRRGASNDEPIDGLNGREGLREAIRKLAKPLFGASGVHVHIKVVHVTSTSTTAKTTAYFEASGATLEGSVQQRATWKCEWARLPQGGLQLTSIRASDYEETSVTGPWMVDRTQAVLGGNRSFREQLSHGHHYWLSRVGLAHGMGAFTRSGMALGDVNGDGLDDIYVCQPGGLPNRLFLQQTDGTVVDRSQNTGVDWLDHSSSALIVDLDNDGHQDLVVATVAGLLVLKNDGQGLFQLKATLALVDTDTQSLTAVDYDNDGDLDMYLCIDFASQPSAEEFVYHDANDGAANILFRNDIAATGQWKFTNVTKQVGLDEDNRRHSLACAWEDYDNDGDQDLYVANDYGQNCLYHNDGGQFRNVAPQVGAVDSASGMSVSWGDYNHDGWMDVYVANMFSSAGNRITRQAQFMPGADDETRGIYSRFAKGNTLLENDGQEKFREVSETAGVEMGRWAWSSVFADLNNDSWEDLLVANGYITTEDTGDL